MTLVNAAARVLPSVWVLVPAVAITYFLSLCVYRIFFHPLSKYPGPLLAKITDLYSTYHALRGDRHIEFLRIHEKYGRVVRFGPNSLSFNTTIALKEIYGHRSNVKKAQFYEAFWASKNAASTHSTTDKSIHARKRRVLSQAFSDAAMKSMERYMLEHVRQFCGNLLGAASSNYNADENKGFGPAVNICDQTNYLAFDTMGDLCFGKAFGMLEGPDNRFAIELVAQASHRHLICGTYLPIHKLHLDKLLFRKIAAGRARYMQYSKAQALERTKIGDDVDRKDFFYYLLKAKDPETGAGFSNTELWGESNLLIIAGSDTTSTALAATTFYLIHNPAKLATLTAEVRSAFSDIEEIHSGSTLSSLSYLRACIDEAMRLSPSVGGLLPREVLAGGMIIDDEQIPEGTIVGVPHYAIQHNPDYYAQPFDFVPERWIVGSGDSGSFSEARVRTAQDAFCPFSIGPRGCIGKGMAYLELTTTIARMAWQFDMRMAPGSTLGEGRPDAKDEYRRRPSEFQLQDTFTSLKDGPMVQFRRRTDL